MAKPATAREPKRITQAKPAASAIVPSQNADLKSPAPEPDEIARLAYSYWQDRGYPEGSPQEDWFRAEHELRKQPRN
jgi:protein tyrosine phosphatase